MEVVERRGARLLVLDPADRLLLLEVAPPNDGCFWITPGGEVEPGENERQAAVRELREETGISVDPERLIGPVWSRDHQFVWDGVSIHQREYFFIARSDGSVTTEPDLSDPTEAATIRQSRWWSLDELRAADPATLVPMMLARQLGRLLRDGPPDSPVDVGA